MRGTEECSSPVTSGFVISYSQKPGQEDPEELVLIGESAIELRIHFVVEHPTGLVQPLPAVSGQVASLALG